MCMVACRRCCLGASGVSWYFVDCVIAECGKKDKSEPLYLLNCTSFLHLDIFRHEVYMSVTYTSQGSLRQYRFSRGGTSVQ
jgi:hypothetical protein